ncbi:recombination protein NinG [Bacteroides faecis]|jgi:hypothetical protein|uniref:recombination protein NinG n=1 Tax=Bacteroides faecis TaxID=674529 RepID=UPI0020646FA4|nr:recombination protein NinG [Bacteroides faecis]MCS3304383.1 recombination protein NinG [Bacteroides faecis]DAQ62145.1 MAG TPA: NinG recombination protein [Caudoviricetes sp.]
MPSVNERLKKRLDIIFGQYIRLRDINEDGYITCISCGRTLSYGESECGHYIGREHMTVRFDEKDCNAQCHTCNHDKRGNPEGYRLGLIRKYGESTVESLEQAKKQTDKMFESDYREKIAHYRKEVKRLKREKL